MNPFLIGLQPLRRFADFRGRSTRTELILFHFLSQLICLAANLAGEFAGFSDGSGRVLAVGVLLCPLVALSVRRLHDTGRSGWWLLLGLPGAAVSVRRDFLFWQNPFDLAYLHPPANVELLAALLAVPLVIFLLLDDQEGPNAYGPNPRYPDDLALSDPTGDAA